MTCSRTQRVLLALAILAAVAPASWAQTNNMHKLTKLGQVPESAMHVPPLTNAKSLARMMAIKRMPGDFRKAFELAGLGSIADGAIATLTSPSSVVAGGDCATSTSRPARSPTARSRRAPPWSGWPIAAVSARARATT